MEQLGFWDIASPPKIVNVSAVPHRSPFRYPGGKTWLVPRVRQWLNRLGVRPSTFIEPFAGGAIVGLTVAFEKMADVVILVEKDEQVAAVWQTIIEVGDGAGWLADRIINFSLTPEAANAIISTKPASTRELAFKTIVQNRVSHGGILADGAGLIKNGERGKGIQSRWYPQTLSRRILDISRIKDRIQFQMGDAFAIIEKYSTDANTVFFVDPPYTASQKKAGTRLYKYHQVDHEKLFDVMAGVAGDFLMSYDDAEEVRALALKHGFETRLVAMNNTHHATMSELLIGRNLGWLDID
jgi:DNA adenine methylase